MNLPYSEYKSRRDALDRAVGKIDSENYITQVNRAALRIGESDKEIISEVKEAIFDHLSESAANDNFGAYR